MTLSTPAITVLKPGRPIREAGGELLIGELIKALDGSVTGIPRRGVTNDQYWTVVAEAVRAQKMAEGDIDLGHWQFDSALGWVCGVYWSPTRS